VFAGVGGASGVWKRLKRRLTTKKKKKKKKEKKVVWFWVYKMEFTPKVETVSVEGEKRCSLSVSSEHTFNPVTVQVDKEAARHFRIRFDISIDFYSRTKAIKKDDDDILVALSMIIGND
jgi:hypothetical protein